MDEWPRENVVYINSETQEKQKHITVSQLCRSRRRRKNNFGILFHIEAKINWRCSCCCCHEKFWSRIYSFFNFNSILIGNLDKNTLLTYVLRTYTQHPHLSIYRCLCTYCTISQYLYDIACICTSSRYLNLRAVCLSVCPTRKKSFAHCLALLCSASQLASQLAYLQATYGTRQS